MPDPTKKAASPASSSASATDPQGAKTPAATGPVTAEQAVQPGAFDYEMYAQQHLGSYVDAQAGTIDYKTLNGRVYRAANTGEAMPVTMPTLAQSAAYAKAAAKQRDEDFDPAAHKRQYAMVLKGYQQYQRGQFNSRNAAFYTPGGVANQLRYGAAGTPENDDNTRRYLGENIDTRSGGGISDTRDEATIKRRNLGAPGFDSSGYVKLGSDRNYAQDNFRKDGELVQQKPGGGYETVETDAKNGQVATKSWLEARDYFDRPENNDKLYRTTVDDEGHYRVERQRPGSDPYLFQGSQSFVSFRGFDALNREFEESDLLGIPRAIAQLPQTVGSGLGQSLSYLQRKTGQGLQHLGLDEAGKQVREAGKQTYARALSLQPTANRDQQQGAFSSLPSFFNVLSQGVGSYAQVALTGGVGTTGLVAQGARVLAPAGMALMATGAAEQGYAGFKQSGATENEADLFGAAMGMATVLSERLFNTRLLRSLGNTVAGKQLTNSLVKGEEAILLNALKNEGKTLGRALTEGEKAAFVQNKFLPGAVQRIASKVRGWNQAFDAKGGYEGMVLNKVPKYLRPALEFGEAFEEAGENLMGDLAGNVYADFVYDGQVYKALDFLPDSLRPKVEERTEESRRQMEAGTAPAAHKDFEQIMAGAWQSAAGGYITGAALSTLQHFRAQQQQQREQVQNDAIAQELVRSGGKGAEKILASIDRMEKAGQFGVGLAPNGQVPEPGQPTVNNLLAQSLRNKVKVYQNLYQQMNVQQLAGRDEKQALELLSRAGQANQAQELALKGLRSGVAVEEQRQQIEQLLTGQNRVTAQAADGSPADDNKLPTQATPGVTVQDDDNATDSQKDSLNLLDFTSSETYQQDFARRRALLEGNVQAAAQAAGSATGSDNTSSSVGVDPAVAGELKALEEEASRAQDRGVIGTLTRHRPTGAYYEAAQQLRALQQQQGQSTTVEQEQALAEQIAQSQEQAQDLRAQALQQSIDNEGAQRMLQLADAQLELEARQAERQKMFTGELMAEHVLGNWTQAYKDSLSDDGEKDPVALQLLDALEDGLAATASPIQKLSTLTRWQQQHLTSQPEAQQQAAEQQFAQAQQATASLVALVEQLPTATLQDEAGLSALVAQTEQIVQNAPALAADNPDLIQALSQDVAAQAKRLTEEGRAALPEAQVLEAAYAQLPGIQEQLQQVTEALTSAQPEDADALVDEQLSLEQQLDDAKADVRSKFQPLLATQLEKAAAKLAALPVQAAAEAALTPVAQLEAQFYTGLHDVMPQPGALKSAVADWLQASGEELSARSEPALARLEQQAALNRLHLELRAQDAPALHAPGALPKGVARKYLAPMEADTYQAADTALRAVEQDLRTVRDKFAQSANSRFGRDNQLHQLATAARHGQLSTMVDTVLNADDEQLALVRPALQGLSKALANASTALLGNDTGAAAQAIVGAEQALRAATAANPGVAVAISRMLLDTLPVTDSRFKQDATSRQIGRYMEGSNYLGNSHDGIFTYLSTVLGADAGEWTQAYKQLAGTLIGTDPASPGKLPSLEQQEVVRAINGFLNGSANLLGDDNILAAEEQRLQQLNAKQNIRVAPHVLYVPGIAGSGKTTVVIRTAMLMQAMLGKRSAATPYHIVATAPHTRQQQTLARQLTGESLQTTARTLDEVINSLRDNSFSGDVLVADEVTIYSDQQTQALLKALSGFNRGRAAAGQAPLRLVALGDPAQMAGRDRTGKRSRSQYFTNAPNRLCLSTRPLSQVYRTGIITAFQLFDKQRARILSIDPGQNADLSPVAGMRFSQAGSDLTTLRGVVYQRADEQRQQAADLIKALQADPNEKRTVRIVVSSQMVQAETDALRALEVVDAGQYVLDADALPNQGGVVNDVDQAQGGEFDFVFTAVAEQYPVDTVGTMADDAVNTLRAQFVGASRMKQYASVRYDAATYGQYQNEQVDQLEEFAPETAADTTARNQEKLQLLGAAVTATPVPMPDATFTTVANLRAAATVAADPVDAIDSAEPVAAEPVAAIPAGAAEPMTTEAQERVVTLNEVAAELDTAALDAALKQGVDFSAAHVALYRTQGTPRITNVPGFIKEELAKAGGDHAMVQALAKNVLRQQLSHVAALNALGSELRAAQVARLAVPGDVLVLEPKTGEFALVDSASRRQKLAEAKGGGLILLDDGQAVTVLSRDPLSEQAREVTRFALVPLEQMRDEDVAAQQAAADLIRREAQRLREVRQQQPAEPVTPANGVPAGDGQLLLPVLAKGQTVNDLALEGRAILSHYAVRESDALADPRYLQANQAFQARLASRLAAVKNGSLSAAELAGLPAPQGREFNGQGAFRLVWQREYQTYGQVDRSPALTRNFFTIEYVEGVNADGMALRRMEIGQIYKDAPGGSSGPITGRIHRGKTASPFDAQLDQLMKDQTQAGAKTVSLPLGSSLPMERVKHPYYNALKNSNATTGGVEATAEASSIYNNETLPYEKLGAELAQRGIAVSSPWVITVKQDDPNAVSQGAKSTDVYLGHQSWATQLHKAVRANGEANKRAEKPVLQGAPVLFYQRSGTQQLSPEQVDAVVEQALVWAADPKNPKTPTQVVKLLFDTHGLEMVMAKTSGFEVELFHYQAALHPGISVPETAQAIEPLLRTLLTEKGEVVRRDGEDVSFEGDARAVKQMLFSSDQFEALTDRKETTPQDMRRGLRNKILRAVQMAGVATKQGDKWVSGAAMNTLAPRQKRHLKAILAQLEQRVFTGKWEHLSAAWAEDLFTYLNYLDARTGGEVSQAWSQDSERNNNAVQLRLYGGSGEGHTVPFSKVMAPKGVPVHKLVGASRLTMTGMGSVVNLHRALQQGQLESNKAAATEFAAPAQTSAVPVVAQSSAAVPEAAPVEASKLKDTDVSQLSAPAAPAISAPAASSDSNMSRRRNSLNQSRLMQGDAYPAEAEARLRQLFGTELEFELNKGISFMRELGQMTGNLITLATDNGLASGLVNFATANHEAIHRVLRIVSPAYRKKVLDAHREVLAKEENSRHTAEQLADDDYVEERLSKYYESADLRSYEAAGEKFRANPVVKFLQGFGAGRLVLRALQAISRAANRLAGNPDYLAELFADMEKGYYRERRVRQRYLEEKANSLNTGDSPKGRRLRDLDSLESVLGGLDIVYDWVDRIKQDTYGDMFEFNPARTRRTFAESRAAVTASAQQFARDIVQEYAGQIPGVHDLDPLRAEDGQWHALQTVVERAGSPDEDGNPTFVQKTAFDIILDYAFAHLGESAGQGVDREGEAVRETQGADGEENEARVNAAITASQDGTNIPAWEKDREAREGASLQMHLDATPLYQVMGWERPTGDGPGWDQPTPLIARDSKKRYVDPRIVQSILDDAFAAAWSTSVYEGSEVLLMSELRSALKGSIASEFGDTQATALSLYLKFFNGLPSDPTRPQENDYLTVRNEQGQDVTPVSFFEVLYPESAVNVQARNAQPTIRESYAREYQHALSEMLMFYQSARRNTAADVNVIEGIKTTGNVSARDERANKEKAMSRENVAGKFLQAAADGTVRLNPAAFARFKRDGFDFAAYSGPKSFVSHLIGEKTPFAWLVEKNQFPHVSYQRHTAEQVSLLDRDTKWRLHNDVQAIAQRLGLSIEPYMEAFVRTSWLQMQAADSLFVVNDFVPSNREYSGMVSQTKRPIIDGKAVWIVEMAIEQKKPVYVWGKIYGSKKRMLHRWDGNTNAFVVTDFPDLAGHVAFATSYGALALDSQATVEEMLGHRQSNQGARAVLTYRNEPFLRWYVDRRTGGGKMVTAEQVSMLPVTEQAGAYAKLLQAAGLDVQQDVLSEMMHDSRHSTKRHSVMGYQRINGVLAHLSAKLWSQALAMQLHEQTPEVAQQHPAAAVVLHPELESSYETKHNLLDVREYSNNPAGEPQVVRSPTAAWGSILRLQGIMSQWAKGGQQSSVRTADGSAKHLRRFTPSMMHRWRQLQVKAKNFRERPRVLAEMAKGEWERKNYAAQLPPAETDIGLYWSGVAQGQPVSWTNKFLSGAFKIADVLELNVLENPLMGKRQSIVKASRGELHDVAAWYLFWGTMIASKGEQVALPNPPKADKTSQNARVLARDNRDKRGADGQLERLAYQYNDPASDTALRELHNSYLAQFYGAVVPRWEQHGGFVKPAGFDSLPVAQAVAVLETHRNAIDGKALKKSALRSGVDYYKTGISPALKAVLAQTPEAFAAQIKQSIQAEARQLIEQGMSGVPEQVWKPIRSNTIVGVPSLYDRTKKFKAEGKDNREPLQAADGSLHPLLLDYLLTHRILAQHLDTALTGHHIYYPKGPVDMAKRGVLDHTAYETPDVTNSRGLPRFQKVLVMDDLSMGSTHGQSQHGSALAAMLRGLGWTQQKINEKFADTVNQDGLAFMDPLHWRLERESQGMKYPLREQIKNIQGGMLSDGTPFVFKNSYLILSNQLLTLGNEQAWNLVAQSLGGYQSPLYQRWLDIRAGMSPEQLAVEADWDQLHEEYVQSRQGDNQLADAHVGRIVLASGNKVAAHSVQDITDVNAYQGAFTVDNLLGGRVLSLYQNPTNSSIANITQENHILAVLRDNYKSMHAIYHLLGQLADQGLNKLMTDVQASAERDGQDGRQFFYEKAVESLTALGNISNSLSLIRYRADENVPLISRQITGAIASAINSASQKQRMNGLRATVATMTGLVPMYNVSWTDENNVPRVERYTRQQLLKRGLATGTDGRTGPVQLVFAEGVQATTGELAFTRLGKYAKDQEGNVVGMAEATPEETENFMRLANEQSPNAAQQLETLIAANGYTLAGQEILVPREVASKFGVKPGDDVVDVNEAGPAYFMEQHDGDEAKALEAWNNWLEFSQPKSTRVPVTNMNSTQMSQVVGFIDGHGNTVVVPSEGEIIAGFDNDGDQTTLEFLEVKQGGLSPQPDSPAGLRTQLFREKTARFGDVRNLNQLVKPLTSDDIQALADASSAEQTRVDYGVSQGFHAHSRSIDIWDANQQGKAGVGPFVKVRETFNNLYASARANEGNALLSQFQVPSYFDGQMFSSLTGNAVGVMDYLEQTANGALDNAKNATLGPLNINQYTFGAYGAAGVTGWSLEQATRVLNHPIARALVQQVQTGNSIYNSKKEDVRLLDVLRENVLGANPGIVDSYNYNPETGASWPKNKTQLTQELVRAVSEKHAANNTQGELTPEQVVEHLLLLTVKGDDLLKIQQVLSPMTGVDSADFDSENQLARLAETLGTTPEKLLSVIMTGKPGETANTIVDPLAVLQANSFAVAGVKAMLEDARLRQQGQTIRQPNTRQAFFGKLRELAPEAKSFKVHGTLQKAFDQVLDANFLRSLGRVSVPITVLDGESDGQLKALLKALDAADLGTAAGRHQFVAGVSNLLYVLKTRGKAEADLFGGLGKSPLLQEMEFDQFENGFGLHAKLARATEMSPEVKNFLEREFSKLSQLGPNGHGEYLQRALATYQLLNQGLVIGRGSMAEIFSPVALANYSKHREKVKHQALAGAAVTTANDLQQVLTRENELLPQIFPKRDKRSEQQLGEDLMLADEMGLEGEELESYLDAQDAQNQVEDNSLYFAASEKLPATLSQKQVLDGLDANGKRLLKKNQLNTVRLRNKASKGNVLYTLQPGKDGKWVRQFPVGNPNLNLYGTPLLSPYPVYAAASPLESLNVQTNENLREHLRQVRAYLRQHNLQDFVEANGELRVMDRYGRPIEVEVRRICE